MKKSTLDILYDLQSIISKTLGVSIDELDVETEISLLPNVDSMRFLEIILQVEKKYGIEIPDSAPFNIKSIGDFEKIVLKHIEESGSTKSTV